MVLAFTDGPMAHHTKESIKTIKNKGMAYILMLTVMYLNESGKKIREKVKAF